MSEHYKTMLKQSILNNPAVHKRDEGINEEWNNFMQRVGNVSTIVRDMTSGDKQRAGAANLLANQLLEGKLIADENVQMKVKDNRTVINKAALNEAKKDGQMDKNVFMAEIEKDAAQRSHDRKVSREKADTLNTLAIKYFRRGDYEKALCYYNKAIDQVRDNPMYYCDRALTNIKLGHFDKVFKDCDLAIRLNERSFKARLYMAKAYKELEELDKLAETRAELELMFPQHDDLIKFFLDKKPALYDEDDDDEDHV